MLAVTKTVDDARGQQSPPQASCGGGAVSSDPWGRVDETGTVYVRTADGEQVVGSWQAGSPEEALAYFERKYEGIVVEIGLLERRGESPAPSGQGGTTAPAPLPLPGDKPPARGGPDAPRQPARAPRPPA